MLQNINFKWALFLAICLGFTTGCDDFGDLNIDPNSPTDIPAENLLTQGQYKLYEIIHSRELNAEWGMLMVQQWSQNEYAEESRYVVDANSFNVNWQEFYASVLNELTIASDKINANTLLSAGRKANQLAIIEILKVDAFHHVTDAWGDVPYSQALNATEFPNPAYDAQSDIYASLLTRLDAALASIDTGSGSFDSGDLIHAGDVNAWKSTGASLLLRMAMRVSDVASDQASEYVNKAIAHGVIMDNVENAMLVFDPSADLSNPLYIDNVINTRDDFCVSELLVTTLQNMNDPRLGAYAALNVEGNYVGMEYGLLDAKAFALKSISSRPADAVRAAQAPKMIIDRAEVAFLMAEAAERGYTTGNAEAMYNAGVTASMGQWGINDSAAIGDYLTANAYGNGTWKESIGLQKWLALYMNGHQAWAEHRRLDQPVLAPSVDSGFDAIPVRLPYPISEETNNGSSLDMVTSDINDFATKVWWDVN